MNTKYNSRSSFGFTLTVSALMLIAVSVFASTTIVFDPNNNSYQLDSTDPLTPDQLGELLGDLEEWVDMEEEADADEDQLDLAAGYGEEPFAVDPEDPNGYQTGNEYLDSQKGKSNKMTLTVGEVISQNLSNPTFFPHGCVVRLTIQPCA